MDKSNSNGLKTATFFAAAILLIFPVFISGQTQGLGAGGQTLGSLVAEPCLVPVYHTDFAFPPEGGQIIRTTDGRMFFVRTYMPGCANAGHIGTSISTTGSNVVNAFPGNEPVVQTVCRP